MKLPLNRQSPHSDEGGSGSRLPSDLGSDLSAYTREGLAAVNRVLIAILRAKDLDELLDEICAALHGPFCVSGCALYRAADDGLGLDIMCVAGNYRPFLPDSVPCGSDLFESITIRKSTDGSVPHDQLSLFSDHSAAIFAPIAVDDTLRGALAVVSSSADIAFLRTILNQAAVALELLYKADSMATSLSMRAEFRDKAQAQPDRECDVAYAKLTAREKEVLDLLTAGLSNKEIAEKLFISNATCKHHIENIFEKLQVHSRTAAVAVGLAHGKGASRGQ